MGTTARDRLAAHDKLAADMVAARPALVGAAAKEADEERARLAAVEWEAIRVIGYLAICRSTATHPVGFKRWLVGVGLAKKQTLLVVYEVTEYRGTRTLSRVYGPPAPLSVDMDVARAEGAVRI